MTLGRPVEPAVESSCSVSSGNDCFVPAVAIDSLLVMMPEVEKYTEAIETGIKRKPTEEYESLRVSDGARRNGCCNSYVGVSWGKGPTNPHSK